MSSYTDKVQRVKNAAPKGFTSLLENLCRIILTHNPRNINKFAAEFLEAELDKRVLMEMTYEGKTTSPI